jgi:hypothetical protein
MKNGIIIAYALVNWEVVDVYRLAAEFVYGCELKEAQQSRTQWLWCAWRKFEKSWMN